MICSSRRNENESTFSENESTFSENENTFSENDFVTYKSQYGQQMYLIKCHLTFFLQCCCIYES